QLQFNKLSLFLKGQVEDFFHRLSLCGNKNRRVSSMKITITFLALFVSTQLCGQVYERNAICGNDTVNVDHISLKTGERIQYNAYECQKVSKLGIRVDIGFNHYKYNSKTRN